MKKTNIEELIPHVYAELRQIAAHHLRGRCAYGTLQPTALVHEAYVRLSRATHIEWNGRTHLLAICASEMRRVLVEHARARSATKRGGDWTRVAMDRITPSAPDRALQVVMLDQALSSLERRHERQASVAELKLFGGLSMREIAEAIEVSERTVKTDWAMAKAWLASRLRELRGDGR